MKKNSVQPGRFALGNESFVEVLNVDGGHEGIVPQAVDSAWKI
jgi:hypothetical protein